MEADVHRSLVKSVFVRAADMAPGERGAWLDSQGLPSQVREEVERLLAYLSGGERFEENWATPSESASSPPDQQAALTSAASGAPPALGPSDCLVDRFEIRRFLGRGGMGEVYEAFDREMRETVALKTLKPDFAADPRWLDQLRLEIRNARLVRNPHVCRLNDFFRQQTPRPVAFLSMELLNGRTLAEEQRETGPVSLERARVLLEQIVLGLDAIHAAGIVHRDLKGANVMLTEGGSRAVIMDFGLSSNTTVGFLDTLSLFGPEAIVGTPAFMAPEQLRGEPATIGFDIHALGVVLFEMLTGQLPFPGSTPLAVALRRLQQEAPTAVSLRPDLPAAWDRTIAACLKREPGERPASAGAVLRLLDSGGGGEPEAGKRPARRRVLAWGGAAATLAATAALTGLRWWGRGSSNDVRATPDAARAAFQRGSELARKVDAENLQAAIAEYEKAVRIFPGYFEAWLALSRVYATATHYSFLEPDAARRKADEAAAAALRIRPGSADALGARAFALSMDLSRWDQAEPLLREAVQLEPNSSQLRCWYAVFLGRSGRHAEAVEQARAAVRGQAGDFQSVNQLVVELLRAGQFEEAFEQAKELVRLRSTEPDPYLALARASEWTGRYAEAETALAECERYARSERNRYAALAGKATLEGARGRREAALRLARQVHAYWQAKPFDSNLLVNIWGRLGEVDRVVEVLDRAARSGDSNLLAAYTNPYLRKWRDDPRLRAFFVRFRLVR